MKIALMVIILILLSFGCADELPDRFSDRTYSGAYEILKDEPTFFAAFPGDLNNREIFILSRDRERITIESPFLINTLASAEGDDSIQIDGEINSRSFVFDQQFSGANDDGLAFSSRIVGDGSFDGSGDRVTIHFQAILTGLNEGVIEIRFEGSLIE